MENFVENNKNLSDNAIVELINNGEYENLRIIIDRYLPQIIKTAEKYCSQHEVEDAVQEATIALYSAVKNFDPAKADFRNFANLCIKRAVISYLRKINLKRAVPEDLILPIEVSDLPYSSTPETLLIEKEEYDNLKNTIKLELSGMEYRVLNLFLEGKTYTEISEEMAIDEKAVDNALVRIRKKLRKQQ